MPKNTLLIVPKKRLDELDEAYALAKTAGYEIVSLITTRYHKPNIIKEGKLKEIKKEVEGKNIETIIFYNEFTPVTYYKLYKIARVELLDKPLLILNIFSRHAGSKEAKLQIELAKIRHEIPIVREFVRRQKLGELPGFLGPGKYAIDEYLALLRRREHQIKLKLEELKKRKKAELLRRKNLGLPHIVITGYTCAGKTTLFNSLVSENKRTGEEYFTTISPKAKGALLHDSFKVIFSDTVGFIRGIPPYIIEAFYATLQEVVFSDLIILVVDASEPIRTINEKLQESLSILDKIGAISIPLFIVLNKIDLIASDELSKALDVVNSIRVEHNNIVDILPMSALRSSDIDALRRRLWSFFQNTRKSMFTD